MLERAGNAQRQALARQATTDSKHELGLARAQRVQHRCGLRQMSETMRGNIDEKMRCQSGFLYHNLGAEFDHPVGRQLEKIRHTARITKHRDE